MPTSLLVLTTSHGPHCCDASEILDPTAAICRFSTRSAPADVITSDNLPLSRPTEGIDLSRLTGVVQLAASPPVRSTCFG